MLAVKYTVSRKLSFIYVHAIDLSFMNELLMYSFIVGSLLNKGLCPDGRSEDVIGFLRILLKVILNLSVPFFVLFQ